MMKFPNATVVIPIVVVEELDKLKKGGDDVARNARAVLRKLDKLSRQGELGQISSGGVGLKNGGSLLVERNHTEELSLDRTVNDNKILSVAKFYAGKDSQTKLLTKDAAVRIKAHALGINAEDYDDARGFTLDDQFKGYREVLAKEETLDGFRRKGSVKLSGNYHPNEYIILHNDDKSDVVIGRFDAERKMLVSKERENTVFGVEARNPEQEMAIDLLLNPNIPLVTITGKAGTGKTLVAIATALELVANRQAFSKVLVARPIIPLGKDLGYLPGTVEEKMNPWMQPIFDNLDLILNMGSNNKGEKNRNVLIDQNLLEIEPLTYIRGRSIPNQFFILDEAQNLSKFELKTILSRVGEGTKIVLTGDPDQIDNPMLDKVSCGLSQVIEKFKGSELAGHVTLEKGERSKLADAVVELLK